MPSILYYVFVKREKNDRNYCQEHLLFPDINFKAVNYFEVINWDYVTTCEAEFFHPKAKIPENK